MFNCSDDLLKSVLVDKADDTNTRIILAAWVHNMSHALILLTLGKNGETFLMSLPNNEWKLRMPSPT